MSILVSLAYATGPAAQTFNSNFFVTAATIIPVLFLAIAVQGPAYDNVLRTAQKVGSTKSGFISKIGGFSVATLLLLIAYVILAATALGEIVALYDLYRGSDSGGGDMQIVFTAILILLAATCAGPALSLARGYGRSWRGLPWESLFTIWLKAARLGEQTAAQQTAAQQTAAQQTAAQQTAAQQTDVRETPTEGP